MNKVHTLLFLLLFTSISTKSQNIFPVKLDKCRVTKFCLDCGDKKATYDEEEFGALINKLNSTLILEGLKGVVKFQVLIDAEGKACVLSHTDQSKSAVTRKLVRELNKFKNWIPAFTDEVVEEKSSINVVFTIVDEEISGKIERVDLKAFRRSFDKPRNPEIFNSSYTYENKSLNSYKITNWNAENSGLTNNMNDDITIDKNGLIWLTIDEGLVTFDGEKFQKENQNITDAGKYFGYFEIATDNNNVKWVSTSKGIFSYNDSIWTSHSEAAIGLKHSNNIINNSKTNELFFCSSNGVVVKKRNQWYTINQDSISDLPSNRITFAKKDSKNRLWIGTYGGTVMIDQNGEVTSFEDSKNILKGKAITSMDEDPSGNLYFSLYEFDRKDKSKVNNNEGIAIYYKNGTLKQFTTDNSGMPFNHATCVLYDDREKILWISTDRAGLVRYDLEDNWENYHNKNSEIPTSYISTMTLDDNGNLFLATRQGLVKLEKK